MTLEQLRNQLSHAVNDIKERMVHPEKFTLAGESLTQLKMRTSFNRYKISCAQWGEPLSREKQISARLELMVMLREIEKELISECHMLAKVNNGKE